MKKVTSSLMLLTLGVVTLTSCQKDLLSGTSITGDTADESDFGAKSLGGGAVFIMDNGTSGNNILAFGRAADGQLTSAGSFATGGLGTGTGLGNQGALVRDENHLFACNPGSDQITVFNINGSNLTQIQVVSSHGTRPVSVTVHEDHVYVLNAGGTGSIAGFHMGGNGQLSYLPGSTQPLSSSMAGAAQIQFNNSGQQLVVTEKATNIIDTYPVSTNGIAGAGTAHPSVGNTPFGFAFGHNNTLIVSDAFGGMAGQSALSSYTLSNSGNLALATGPVGNGQTAACWVAVTNNGKLCYTTNTAAANISGYRVSNTGALTLINSSGISATTGDGPIDLSLSNNSKFVYSLNSGGHSISMFRVNNDGSLASIGPDITGLPVGANGMAAQ